MLNGSKERKALDRFIRGAVEEHRSKDGSGGATRNGGQALVEYALTVPLLVLLIVNCVNFGYFIYTWITVSNGSRAGVQYAILAGASAGGLTPATGSQITTVIENDMSSLPNTPTINICKCIDAASAGTCPKANVTTLAGTCSSVQADPETPLYVLTTVQVTYNYSPPIGGLIFPKLGIYATIPPTAVTRTAEMRSIQ